MEKPTFYDRLGVPRDATLEEIRRAYRQLVLHLHPDTNINKGETELFIDIQSAYEQLSDPAKKTEYDRGLPVEPDSSGPLHIAAHYSQPALVRLGEPQLHYILLELDLRPDTNQLISSTPLNLSLVVDCSTSMQGNRLDVIKSTAIDMIRQLRPNDIFSLVKFNDRAELLIPASSLSDIKSTEMKIQLLQAGGGTEIFKGMEMGFSQVRQRQSSGRVNHIILITDGRTYGDETNCDILADQCSAFGIGISAVGIGSQWNDVFLDRITSKTGGTCQYISNSGDIRRSILDEIKRLGSSLTEQIVLSYQPTDAAELLSAYRLKPDPAPLFSGSPMILGLMPVRGVISVLLEFVIKEIPADLSCITLVNGFVKYEIPRHQEKNYYVQRLVLDRQITREAIKEPPPAVIMDAVSVLSLNRMQESARAELEKGNFHSASRHMQNLATRLLQKGEVNLADTVLEEMEYIQRNQTFSEDGEKRIKYGTRSLLLPPGTEVSKL